MNSIFSKIAFIVLIFLLLTTIVFAADVTCFEVGWFTLSGEPQCAIACTDGTLFPMSCDADIF